MKVIVPGHRYEVSHFEDKENFSIIQFIHKAPSEDDPSIFKTLRDGTTNEEVLAVLINRIELLNEKLPCIENLLVLNHLRDSLELLKARTRQRVSAGTDGTNKQ